MTVPTSLDDPELMRSSRKWAESVSGRRSEGLARSLSHRSNRKRIEGGVEYGLSAAAVLGAGAPACSHRLGSGSVEAQGQVAGRGPILPEQDAKCP